MAPRVHAPVEDYTGTVAGVAFVDGSGETENGAALAYFQRKGYRIEDAPKVTAAAVSAERIAVGTISADMIAAADAQIIIESNSSASPVAPVPVAPVAPDPVVPVEPVEPVSVEPVVPEPVEPVSTKPERPHPVQGNKAVWFAYLSEIKPDHGLDLEKVQRKELIAAANEVDGITAE